MTKTKRLLAVIAIIVGLDSCELQPIKIPSYIYLKPFTFNAKPGEGSAHQNLTDGWIYVNHNYYGAYELPAWIPVLDDGFREVRIFPGYRQDGMITNSFQYALLNPDTSHITLIPGKTDTITPSTSYQDGLVFSWIENFDGDNIFQDGLDVDGDLETKVTLSPTNEAFEGSNSGLIELYSAHPTLTAESKTTKIIPQSGDPIILELDFKSDIPFFIGVVGYSSVNGRNEQIDAGILAKKVWTKVYFDFRTIINAANSDYYTLAIHADFQADSALTKQRILLDNIKIIHR